MSVCSKQDTITGKAFLGRAPRNADADIATVSGSLYRIPINLGMSYPKTVDFIAQVICDAKRGIIRPFPCTRVVNRVTAFARVINFFALDDSFYVAGRVLVPRFYRVFINRPLGDDIRDASPPMIFTPVVATSRIEPRVNVLSRCSPVFCDPRDRVAPGCWLGAVAIPP